MIPLLLACTAPTGSTLERPAWTGVVDRDGEEVAFIGHVPYDEGLSFPAHQHFMDAIAGLHTDDGALVGWLSLRMWHFELAMQEQQAELPVLSQGELVNDRAGFVLDYLESWPEPADPEEPYRYVSMHSWNRGGDTTGTLTLTDTDWESWLEAELEAEIDDPDLEPRRFAVTVRWQAED